MIIIIIDIILAGGASAAQAGDDHGHDHGYGYYSDIYILMKCLSVCVFVTKNDHFLLGVSCNHLNPP